MTNIDSIFEPGESRSLSITIGWTRSDMDNGYSSFSGYRPGASQHTETITVTAPADITAHQVAEEVFMATNTSVPTDGSTLASRIAIAVMDSGYRGQGAHYSLSTGDTVTVGETMLACASLGWTEVPNFGKVVA